MTEITINAADGGSFMGYLATPPSGSGPGIVVIQEIFGVNKVMRDITDWYASQGFVALCPDIFWRIEPGIQLTDQTEEEWQKAFELFGKFDLDKGTEDLKAALATLRGQDGCTGKAGSVGYCLGGRLAYLMACRSDAEANVGYYGVGIPDNIDEAKNISSPLMLHIAEEDGFVDKDQQKAIHDALDDHPQVTLVDYPGRDHAFARVGGEHYHEADAKAANKRTIDFFEEHLG
jgi:carboxymethylenebutenolidase